MPDTTPKTTKGVGTFPELQVRGVGFVTQPPGFDPEGGNTESPPEPPDPKEKEEAASDNEA